MKGSSWLIGASIWQSLVSVLRGERVFVHNVIVGVGTLGAGGLGVAFQVVVSHHFQPADYGGVFSVVTLITLIGLPASAVTLLMARSASRDHVTGDRAPSTALLRGGNRALLLAGLALAGALAASAPLLAGFLAVPSELILAAALGLPFAMAFPLLLGEFQGEQRFVAFSVMLMAQAGVKLAAAIALGLFLGPVGIIGGISLGTATVYLVSWLLLRQRLSTASTTRWWRSAATYLAVVIPSTLALSVLLSADVLLVKHFFPTRQAGEYSAVAALGRAIFWSASGVAGVLFPKMVYRQSQLRGGMSLVGASILLVVVGGVIGSVLLWVAAPALLTAFAGSAYRDGAGYLPWYGLGMTLLGGVAVLVATQQSHGKPAFLAVLIPLTLLEPTLIAVFHQSLLQVVQVVDLSMALVLVAVGAQFALQTRAGNIQAPAINSRANVIAQLPANQ